MIKRTIYEKLIEELKNKQITALVGARQVGKTTLMQEVYKSVTKESVFITFEKREDLNLFENNIEDFIEKYVEPNKYLFIDEFQYAKEGGKLLKYIYDTKKIKIFISDSSHAELAIQSLQFLVGRVIIFEIYPLTFEEFINFRSEKDRYIFNKKRDQKTIETIKRYFEEYITFGGYPEVVLEKDEKKKKEILKSIIDTYLLKEIKDILAYKNIHEYERLLERLALQDSKLLNKNSFSQDLGIHNNKVDEMIQILDRTYVISQLLPYLKNKIKEQIKSPKTYMQDLGLKNSLINNFNSLNLRLDKGEIYENFVYNRIKRIGEKIRFWNEHNRYEIDFVIEKNGNIYGIEVKSKLNNNSLTKSTKRFIDNYNPRVVYIVNEFIDDKFKYQNTKVVFTNYINVLEILKE